MAHKGPADDGKRSLALDVPVESISIDGEESEEREGKIFAAGREAGGFMSWALVGSFLLLFTVFWAPRPENEKRKS